jgi:uncharacterized protein YkwD
MCQRVRAAQQLAHGAGVRRVALVAILTGVVVTAAAPAAAGRRVDACESRAPDEASLMVCLINRERLAHRRLPLAWQPELASMAWVYGREMVARRFFSHVSPAA